MCGGEREPAPLRRIPEHLHRRGEQLHDLVGLDPPLDIGGDKAEEGVDPPAGRRRLERVERCQDLDLIREQADLLLRLAQSGREEVSVARLRPTAGKAELAAVNAMVGAKEQQDPQHAVRIAEDGGQDRGVRKRSSRGQASERSRSSVVSRRRISRASPEPTRTAAGRVTPL